MTLNHHTLAKTGRAIVAIAAAYAFVLQVLLLSIMATQAAAAGQDTHSLIICVGTGDNTTADTLPAQTPAKVHCSLLCAQAMAAAAPPPSGVSLGVAFENGAPLTAIAVALAGVRAPPSPKLSQGPPQIA